MGLKFLFFSLFFVQFVFAQEFNIDTKKATVSFNYISEKTKGTLSGVEAKIRINYSNLKSSTVFGTVDVATLSTGNKMRDKHLKSKDFFDVENHPKMSFTSEFIKKEGKLYQANGVLKIKGIEKNVIFNLEEMKGLLVFKTTIYAADFDVAIKKEREKSKVEITVKIPVK
jgi:polyisoprenoid-binding protein YceI